MTTTTAQQPVSEFVDFRDFEFSNRWFLTAIYDTGYTPQDLEIQRFVRTDPTMQSLVRQTIFNEWNRNTPILRDTDWRHYLGNARPAILLQTQSNKDGKSAVIYYNAGDTLRPGKKLAQEIANSIRAYVRDCPDGSCPWNPRPRPTPEPSPEPSPEPTPAPLVPTIEPEIDEQATEEEKQIPLLFFLIPAAGAALAMRQKVQEGR